MAVARVVDAGEVGRFGTGPEGNFHHERWVQRHKVFLRRNGNSLALRAELSDALFSTARRRKSRLARKTTDVEAVGDEEETRSESDGVEMEEESGEHFGGGEERWVKNYWPVEDIRSVRR